MRPPSSNETLRQYFAELFAIRQTDHQKRREDPVISAHLREYEAFAARAARKQRRR
jgi:hypothetical protein